MKIAGIIAEYNPFHNGHAYHIRETRRLSGCDYVVICMAGNFTQRGEAAYLDKWSRARAALLCGADAVFELPALWAVRPANAFAMGGVTILSGLGCDVLSFGSETDDLSLIERLAELGETEPPEVSKLIRAGLDAGKSHARARGEALAEYLGVAPEQLNAPNMTLAVEYLRAIHKLNPSMRPLAIPRIGGYHDTAMGQFASASAIRDSLSRGKIAEVCRSVPPAAQHFIEIAHDLGMHEPDDILIYVLRGMSAEQIAALPGVDEGLGNRLQRCAQKAASQFELIEMLKCKRYTRARLSRLCAHAMLGVTSELIQAHPQPEYARLLGCREDARALLHEFKIRSALPIVSDPVKLRGDPVFQLEHRATELHALCRDHPGARRGGHEFRMRFVKE